MSTSDVDKANILNNYFQSVFTIDNGLLPTIPSRIPSTSPGISDVTISPEIVFRLLSKLKINSAAGPDRLPPIFFRKASISLCFPLSILFRLFIDLHDLPSEWKHAIVSPKFKTGSPSDPANYRPIALTCTCCKILESVIASDLILFLDSHNLISKTQHGFLKKHSTCTNLLESLNDWTLSISNHKSVVIGYVDFARAFDSIPYPKLFLKLTSYGINGNLLFWIQAFLSNRTQAVRIGSSLSSTCCVTSGVPQGSVLGPLLFNLYVNDITDNFDKNISVKLFADDVKLYTELSNLFSADCFQTHLNYIQSWSLTWQINISYCKCNILQIGPSKTLPSFYFSNFQISETTLVKDLGIYIDPKLKFKSHINDIARRSKQRSSLIFRCFLSRDTSNFLQAYKVYIRPLLEYDSPVWSPSQVHLINIIEDVQRSFTRRLPGLSGLSYAERLAKLKLQSLEHRRLILDLFFCYKIVHGSSAIKPDSFFAKSLRPSPRGHPYSFIIPQAKHDTRKNFFNVRIIKIWNSLPNEIVTATSIHSFKYHLLKHDLSKFLIFPCILK